MQASRWELLVLWTCLAYTVSGKSISPRDCTQDCDVTFSDVVYGKNEAPVLDLFGPGLSQLSSISVRRISNAGPTGTEQRLPKMHLGSMLRWTLCAPERAENIKAQIRFLEDSSGLVRVGMENNSVTLRESEQTWKLFSHEISYRRLPTSTQPLLIKALDTVPATACLTDQCLSDGGVDLQGLLISGRADCRDFTSCLKITPRAKDSYLYIRPKVASAQQAPLKVVKIRDSVVGEECDEQPPSGNTDGEVPESLVSRTKASHSQQKQIQRPTKNRGNNAPKSAQTHMVRHPADNVGKKKNSSHNRAAASGAGASAEINAEAPASHYLSDNSDRSAHVSNTANANGNTLNLSIQLPSPAVRPEGRAVADLSAQVENTPPPNGSPPSKARFVESSRPQLDEDDQTRHVDDITRSHVRLRQPRTLQLLSTVHEAQGGPLLFQLNASAPVQALLHLGPNSTVVRLSSPRGGTASQQICRRLLPHGVLWATISSPSEDTVPFSAQLKQAPSALRMGDVLELPLVPQKPSVRELRFPDWTSPVSLKAGLTPGRCMLISVYKQVCRAVAGTRKVGEIFKYISGNDLLPITVSQFTNRTAFVRAEWAPPGKCGLPAATSKTPLRALLGVVSDTSNSSAWMLLLPALTSVLLPVLVVAIVRQNSTRLLRAIQKETEDNGGVRIEEVQTEPNPPLHSTLAGTNVIPTGGSITSKTSSVSCEQVSEPAPPRVKPAQEPSVLADSGYQDLIVEKAALARDVTHTVYPDLSEADNQEASSLTHEKNDLSGESWTKVEVPPDAGTVKDKMAARLGVGGVPASPSAPQAVVRPFGTSALLPICDGERQLAATADVGKLQLQRDSSAVSVLCWTAPVLAGTMHDLVSPLQSFQSGDVGACATAGVPASVSAAAVLVPGATFAGTLWIVRRSWRRVPQWTESSPYTLRLTESSRVSGSVPPPRWPAMGAEWLVMVQAVQSALASLCPGHIHLFTSNILVAALLGQLASSRLSGAGGRPLPAAVAASALVSARGWLPVPWSSVAAAAAGALHLMVVWRLYSCTLLPRDHGSLTPIQRVQLAVTQAPRFTLTVAAANIAVGCAGALVLSPGGYLALFSGVNALAVMVATKRGKELPGHRRSPCGSYSRVSLLVGTVVFFVAVIIGELQHHQFVGAADAAGFQAFFYLTAMVLLTLGTVPRDLMP